MELFWGVSVLKMSENREEHRATSRIWSIAKLSRNENRY